jgi:hypothetical protein
MYFVIPVPVLNLAILKISLSSFWISWKRNINYNPKTSGVPRKESTLLVCFVKILINVCPFPNLRSIINMSGKYLELWTIWKVHISEDKIGRGLSSGKWIPRPVGILFCQPKPKQPNPPNMQNAEAQNRPWIFLILIAPVSNRDDPDIEGTEGYKFHYRKGAHRDEKFAWTEGESTAGGIPNYVNDAQSHAVKTSQEVCGNESPPKTSEDFLYEIIRDVLWGWERYVAAVRNDIRAVLRVLYLGN